MLRFRSLVRFSATTETQKTYIMQSTLWKRKQHQQRPPEVLLRPLAQQLHLLLLQLPLPLLLHLQPALGLLHR